MINASVMDTITPLQPSGRISRIAGGLLTDCTAIAIPGYIYSDSLLILLGSWIGSEDYSYGVFVPLISLLLIWQARHRIAIVGIGTSWWGLAVVSAGLLMYVMGEFATLYIVQHLSLWLVIV